MLRFAALVVTLSIGVLPGLGGEALAQGPKPEPAHVSPSLPLQPDPAPNAHPARTVSAGSSPTLHRSISPPAAPSTHATVSSSVDPPVSPAAGPSARKPAEKQGPPTIRRTTQNPSRTLSPSALRRIGAFPAFLFQRTSIRAIAAPPVPESVSPESTFLLAGGLALVVLVLGETTFLMIVGRRIGVRPSRRPKQVYWEADGPIRRVRVER